MVDGNQNVEERKIGIYTGQVWHSDLTLKADFDVSRLSELNAPNIILGKPFIVISVGDARGIGVVKAPEVNGTALTIEPGTGLEWKLVTSMISSKVHPAAARVACKLSNASLTCC